MRPTLVVLFVVLSYIPMLPGAEYFISPSGNDQASGTKEAPLASLARGLEKLRGEPGKAGTLWLEDGVHAIHATLVLETTDEKITVRAVHEGRAVLDAATSVPAGALMVSDDPRLDAAARGKVVAIDLAKLGVKHTKKFPDRFNDGGGVLQLFADRKSVV